MNDWARENRKLIAVFAAGVLLGAISVRQGYEGFRFAGSEYVLIKKASIPKSLSLQGRWLYETKASGADLNYNKLTCKSILGVADISQGQEGAPVSNEFSIDNAIRRACVDNQGKVLKTDVSWNSRNASVLPNSRKIIVSLITSDPNPRFGYIEGSIPSTEPEKAPSEFSGNMYYLNTQNQTYGSTIIRFCKEGTECARTIEKQF